MKNIKRKISIKTRNRKGSDKWTKKWNKKLRR